MHCRLKMFIITLIQMRRYKLDKKNNSLIMDIIFVLNTPTPGYNRLHSLGSATEQSSHVEKPL